MALYLISKGADVNVITKSGDSVLLIAASTDNLELLQHLLSPHFKGLKVSINHANNFGKQSILILPVMKLSVIIIQE